MSFLSSIDKRDRKILFWCLGAAVFLAVVSGVLIAKSSEDDNTLPSSYLTGKHGARAAYETLLSAGYDMQHWERPLSELAEQAGPGTVVILAEPYSGEREDAKAIKQIVEKGGRVLATGFRGGNLLPGGAPTASPQFSFAACKLEPEGLDRLASSGTVWMAPIVTWQLGDPFDHVQYSCGGQPAVVEYDYGKGHAVWWASATPLENASLGRDQNLDLLLNSVGPREGAHVYWDESLHGEIRSTWSYAAGPALTLLELGLLGMGVLVIFSFSRRSGPLRDEPAPARAAPIEFLEALGSLYRSAGASGTAVSVAYERFRRRMQRLCGLRNEQMDAVTLAALLRRRFPQADPALETDLAACQESAANDTLQPRAALKMIQALHRHDKALRLAAHAASEPNTSHPEEKAS
jgi:hypothetical protein